MIAMDVRFMNPFISAASEILEKEVQVQVARGQITLQKSAYTTEEITIMIGLTGQVEGMVTYGISEDTAKAFVSQMMGQEWSVLDDLAQSAIGELGNMITGLASTELSNAGYETKISPPMLILGKEVLISTLDLHRLVVSLQTPHGPVQIHLSLREVTSRSPGRGLTVISATSRQRH
ncbi:MAG: chemotaxis protein CheX [Candidatus Tectomicrobia bacterium]|uniref:Chemotaxis protein CheX n=1 Tax=Tectimicrobiota bacterium TaxID=2528274 RepID=A0A932FVK6_UNCTE|nr:chemotaxis protein CheX [Candidatus Tectomicrobia bacterium]